MVAAQSAPTAVVEVKVNGSALSHALASSLVEAMVETSVVLPGRFTLTYDDVERTVVSKAGMSIGADVSIAVIAGGTMTTLIEAEVTSLELDFGPDGIRTVVRGLDRLHRMARGTATKAWVNVTASEVAEQLGRKYGIEPGTIHPTTFVYPQLTQANLSDWAFLRQLAAESGREAYLSYGKLNFCKPPSASEAPPAGTLSSSESTALVLGKDLLWAHVVMSAAEQVQEVSVRGWDPASKQAVVGQASASSAPWTDPGQAGLHPGSLASQFNGDRFVVTNRIYDNQSLADERARSVAERLAGAVVEIEGECLGNPKLQAGTAFSLGLVGDEFSGRYSATATRHRVDPTLGYVTWFAVSTRGDGSLMHGGAGLTGMSHAVGPLMGGVVPAVVTDVNDPERLNRVKVQFPWLDDRYVSDWSRMVQLGASAGYGFLVMPEVNDEVLVAFEHGDPRRAYVIGNLYNGVDTSGAPGNLVSGGKVTQRRLMSREHHQVLFMDGPDSSGITIVDGAGSESIVIDASSKQITIKAGAKIAIEAPQGIDMRSSGGTFSIQATEVAIKADSKVAVQAAGELALAADGQAQLQAQGILSVKGSLVQIN